MMLLNFANIMNMMNLKFIPCMHLKWWHWSDIELVKRLRGIFSDCCEQTWLCDTTLQWWYPDIISWRSPTMVMNLNSQNTPHSLPSRASYGASFVSTAETMTLLYRIVMTDLVLMKNPGNRHEFNISYIPTVSHMATIDAKLWPRGDRFIFCDWYSKVWWLDSMEYVTKATKIFLIISHKDLLLNHSSNRWIHLLF